MPELKPKIRKFCMEYLKNPNGAQAAIAAGYAVGSAKVAAARLLTKANVKAFLANQLAKVEEKAIVDKAFFLTTCREVVERGLQKTPVMEFDHVEKELKQKEEWIDDPDAPGAQKLVGVWECDLSAVNGANRMVGQYLKLLTDKVEHTVSLSLESLLSGSREEEK